MSSELIQALAKEIHHEGEYESQTYPLDYSTILRFKERIQEVDIKEFILVNFRLFDREYCTKLLLYLYPRWREISYSEWIDIFSTTVDSPSVNRVVEFAYKYLKVDSLLIIFNLNKPESIRKREILEYYLRCKPFLAFSSMETEMIEEIKEEVDFNMSLPNSYLVNQGAPVAKNADEIQPAIKVLLDQLNVQLSK